MYRREIIKKNRAYRRRQRRVYRLAAVAGRASLGMMIVSVLAVGMKPIDPVRGMLFIGVFGVLAAVSGSVAGAVEEE